MLEEENGADIKTNVELWVAQWMLLRAVMAKNRRLPKENFDDFVSRLRSGKSVFEEEQKNCEKKFDENFAAVYEVMKRLPKEILDTVEDPRLFCMGYSSKETMRVLKKYKDFGKGIDRLEELSLKL